MSEAAKTPIRIHHVPAVQEAIPVQLNQKKTRPIWPWLTVGSVLVLALALVGFLFLERLKEGNTQPADKYQAVFLTNGQVYFGKLSNPTRDYLTLRDIYYLQVTQPPLQGSVGQTQQQATQGQQPQVSLVKLGNELHGPEDEMYISRSQLLFYEDLKEDGQVVKAIREYKVNPQHQTPQ